MTTLKPPFRSNDMNGLYKRVLKGTYPDIPKKYTKDLSDVIAKLLSVEPKLRPSCSHVLSSDIVQKRMVKLFPNNEIKWEEDRGEDEHEQSPVRDQNNILLNTIKVPHNLSNLTKKLPKANYSMKVPIGRNHIVQQ